MVEKERGKSICITQSFRGLNTVAFPKRLNLPHQVLVTASVNTLLKIHLGENTLLCICTPTYTIN